MAVTDFSDKAELDRRLNQYRAELSQSEGRLRLLNDELESIKKRKDDVSDDTLKIKKIYANQTLCSEQKQLEKEEDLMGVGVTFCVAMLLLLALAFTTMPSVIVPCIAGALFCVCVSAFYAHHAYQTNGALQEINEDIKINLEGIEQNNKTIYSIDREFTPEKYAELIELQKDIAGLKNSIAQLSGQETDPNNSLSYPETATVGTSTAALPPNVFSLENQAAFFVNGPGAAGVPPPSQPSASCGAAP